MKKTLAILAMLLVIVMALGACGGGEAPSTKEGSRESTAAPSQSEAETTAPESKAEPTRPSVDPPEKFVGVWQSVIGSETITINADGTAKLNAEDACFADNCFAILRLQNGTSFAKYKFGGVFSLFGSS